jgi:GntR family transcriptional regulator/MocR family aminotransferase
VAKRSRTIALPLLDLDSQRSAPLHRQLYDDLRSAILSGRIASGAPLPSQRLLAKANGISRNTVSLAYEQLLSEGYLIAQVGSGTCVSLDLPDERTHARLASTRGDRPTRCTLRLPERSERLRLLATSPQPEVDGHGVPTAFPLGLPAVDSFPFTLWGRLQSRCWRETHRSLFGYQDPLGLPALRSAACDYLRVARGVRCEPEQVIIVSGSQQAIFLAAQSLLEPGDGVWIEDPGYRGARGALLAAGASLVPVPVDEEGMVIRQGVAEARRAKLAFLTPACQFPLGVTLSLSRRMELLDWADRTNAWVLEDDYDSEYRYSGRPLATLQGLAPDRVILIGSFSKVLFPSLRLGYLVIPPQLLEVFRAARQFIYGPPPALNQAVVATFIREGHFERHLRRTRLLYKSRQTDLIEACRKHLAGTLEVQHAQAGMHLLGWLPKRMEDSAVSAAAADVGVQVLPLSAYSIRHRQEPALLLGYTSTNRPLMDRAVRQLAKVFRALSSP